MEMLWGDNEKGHSDIHIIIIIIIVVVLVLVVCT